jgi:hypothetical protein
VCSGGGKGSLILWDVATGIETARLKGNKSRIDHIRFFAEDALLYSVSTEGTTRIWDAATGSELQHMPKSGWSAAVSPDGKMLATGSGDGTVRLWEIASGKERKRFEGHRGQVSSMEFLADGRTLVSGCADATVLCWDITGRRADNNQPTRPLGAEELKLEWDHFFGANVERSFQALWVLAEHPQQTVKALGKELKPVAPLDPKVIAQWIVELDDDDFAKRENASAELTKAGDVAWAAMKKVLENQQSLEVKFRIQQILKSAGGTLASNSPQLRLMRSLELLGHLRTPEARTLLQSLAGGAPEGWLTRQAKLILKQLP